MRRPLCAFCLSALGVLALCSFLPQMGLLLPSAAIFVGFCLLVWWKGGAARGYAVCLLLGALGIANMWLAIFADVGVMVLAVLNAIRALFVKNL
mgnify:CR=1 FL=1